MTAPLMPVVIGPATLVANDRYDAFPVATELSNGNYLVAYRNGSQHASADGKIALRISENLGESWSHPPRTIAPVAGRALGPTALEADGFGRVYLLAVEYRSTGANSADDFIPRLFVSQNDGDTWNETFMPTPRPGLNYPHALCITDSGAVIVSMYVKNAGSGKWDAWYYKSVNQGETWQPWGIVIVANRDLTEPSVTQLTNGTIMSILRSDGGGLPAYHDRYYVTYRHPTAASWSTPVPYLEHATGAPSVTRILGGHLLLYRGFATLPEEKDGQKYPMRAALLDNSGAVCRRDIDLTPNDDRRFLYGKLVGASGTRIVYSAEQELGPQAGVYSLPVSFVPVPTY